MSSLFITGASGFIGQHLLRKLDFARFDCVYCLSRNRTPFSPEPRLQVVRGSLLDPTTYASSLAKSDTVVHLAATTGKATVEQHMAVNAHGTEVLIEQCEREGVGNFLFVSTIAVKYQDNANYPYARSKRQAEEALERSRLNYAIVRPTIVVGREGATWKMLSTLASLPLPLVPGTGAVPIQPIYIEDLVDCLLAILAGNRFTREVFELGGPEETTFESFIKRIRFYKYGKDAPVLHVPLRPVTTLLSLLEPVAPIGAGQFSVWSNDGTIQPNQVFRAQAPCMKKIDEMLRQVIENE